MRPRVELAIALFALAHLAAGCSGDDNAASEATPLTTNAPDPAVVQVYADAVAVQQLADYINNAYATSPAAGLVAVASANYLVWKGNVTTEQCVHYLRTQLGQLAGARLSETFALETLTARPGQVADAFGVEGRLYAVSATLHWGGTTEESTRVTVGVAVVTDGTAKSIGNCA